MCLMSVSSSCLLAACRRSTCMFPLFFLFDARAEILSKGRLDQVHGLSWVRGQRRCDSMVLEMCTFMACGAEITVTTVRNGYIADSCQWLQGSARLRRTAALHN